MRGQVLLSIELPDLAATTRLGSALAEIIRARLLPALLLRGPLGSGKTRLIAETVKNLPGGDEAEVASPSFTICNFYATDPPILHCDFYRCQNAPDGIWDFLDAKDGVLMLEWAERLRPAPAESLDISLNLVKNGRLASIAGRGLAGERAVQLLAERCKTARLAVSASA